MKHSMQLKYIFDLIDNELYQRFMANCNRTNLNDDDIDFREYHLQDKHSNVKDVIKFSFLWRSSLEGFAYWATISDKIEDNDTINCLNEQFFIF